MAGSISLYLGLLLFSFFVSSIAIIPFIDFLYRIKFILHHPHPRDPVKIGTPVGGGLLLIFLLSLLFFVAMSLIDGLGVYIQSAFAIKEEINILFLTLIIFGLIGLYEDITKIFGASLRGHYKNVLQAAASLFISFLLYTNLSLDFINLPLLGVLPLGPWFILVSALIIFTFSRGLDITDGLDGLASGNLLISLLAFWVISAAALDTVLSTFIAVWVGGLIAFLYFNVYPARIWLGDAGSLAFGATLAVIGLLLGKTSALLVIGGIFLIEGASNAIDTVCQALLKRPLFPISPPHYWLQSKGWSEAKVTLRSWLVAIVLALVGLWLSYV